MSAVVPGRATTDATREFASRWQAQGFVADGYRRLGHADLTVSALGFGAYRIDDEAPAHREALEHALLNGCNLIDTSTNYAIGGSERCIGATLADLIAAGQLTRKEVVVVTKVGYVQGDNLTLARERERRGQPFPEMVKYDEHCWHCIHPEFIADQLALSLQRLRLECVDVYLLHNPEYFLSDAAHRGVNVETARAEFYDRLRRAFAYLEEQVAAGRIARYGVSSNSFPKPVADPEFTSISAMMDIARELVRDCAGDENAHHFAVVQLPANLYESGALRVKNNGEGNAMTALEYARANELGVLVNRPLNAFHRQRMIRLADFPIVPTPRPLTVQLAIGQELEDEFAQTIAPTMQVRGGDVAPGEFFRWGSELERALPQLGDAARWHDLVEHQIWPNVRYVIDQLDAAMQGEAGEAWTRWRDRYQSELRALLQCVSNECARQTNAQSAGLKQHLEPHLPAELRDESLSRKALHALASLDGVTCVLCGMRRVAYVDDALGVMKWPRLGDAMPLFF